MNCQHNLFASQGYKIFPQVLVGKVFVRKQNADLCDKNPVKAQTINCINIPKTQNKQHHYNMFHCVRTLPLHAAVRALT